MSARILLVAALALAVGVGGGVAYERHAEKSGAADAKKILYWVAPMDPNYRRDAPGKSPMGMDLIPVFEGQEKASAAEDPDVVALSPAVINTIGVRTGRAERVSLGADVRTVGYVGLNEDRTSHVHVRKEGWIEGLKIRSLGAEVERGDLLFEFFSPELAASSYEYVRDLDRGGSGLTAGWRAKLKALGVSESQIKEIASTRKPADRIRVHAPQDGVVVQLGVGEGMYIKPDQTIMSLSDLSSVWVIADVFESQSSRVVPGMPAEARLAHLPEDVWRGTVDYIYPELDPVTRTLRVRLRFPNPDLKLRPNMFADITLKGKARDNVLAVPTEAVIRTGHSERVVLALGDGRYRAVPVTTGGQFEGRTEILSGLNDGAEVVRSGQFLIDSEANLNAGFARMEDPAPVETAVHDHEPGTPEAWGEGVVEAVKEGGAVVTLRHGPIPAIGWPGMTMDMRLAPDARAQTLATGDAIRFGLAKDAEGMFLIVAVEPGKAEATQ